MFSRVSLCWPGLPGTRGTAVTPEGDGGGGGGGAEGGRGGGGRSRIRVMAGSRFCDKQCCSLGGWRLFLCSGAAGELAMASLVFHGNREGLGSLNGGAGALRSYLLILWGVAVRLVVMKAEKKAV